MVKHYWVNQKKRPNTVLNFSQLQPLALTWSIYPRRTRIMFKEEPVTNSVKTCWSYLRRPWRTCYLQGKIDFVNKKQLTVFFCSHRWWYQTCMWLKQDAYSGYTIYWIGNCLLKYLNAINPFDQPGVEAIT